MGARAAGRGRGGGPLAASDLPVTFAVGVFTVRGSRRPSPGWARDATSHQDGLGVAPLQDKGKSFANATRVAGPLDVKGWGICGEALGRQGLNEILNPRGRETKGLPNQCPKSPAYSTQVGLVTGALNLGPRRSSPAPAAPSVAPV